MANWLSGYTTRKKITIDYTKIDDDLTDFPVLVKLTSSNFDFSKANSDGFDVRFTSDNGTTLLKYERERHDSDNEVAEYWVKIPSISSTEDTDFYLYFRSLDTADGADPTNVWDSSFKMVQHMNDKTTSTIEDSTSNNNDGTKKGANEPIEADGKVAKAQDFDGTDDYITVPDSSSLDITGSITLEALIKPDTVSGYRTFVCKGRTSASVENTNYAFRQYGANLDFYYRYNTIWHAYTVSNQFSVGNWYHVAVTYTFGTGTSIKVYINGVQKTGSWGESCTGNDPAQTNDISLKIGKIYDASSELFDGLIDEVRISNVARSAAWIKASYYSGNNSLVSYGSEEAIITNRRRLLII